MDCIFLIAGVNLLQDSLTPLNDSYNSGCGMTGDSVSGGNTYQKWVNDCYTKAVSSTVFGREYRRNPSQNNRQGGKNLASERINLRRKVKRTELLFMYGINKSAYARMTEPLGNQ